MKKGRDAVYGSYRPVSVLPFYRCSYSVTCCQLYQSCLWSNSHLHTLPYHPYRHFSPFALSRHVPVTLNTLFIAPVTSDCNLLTCNTCHHSHVAILTTISFNTSTAHILDGGAIRIQFPNSQIHSVQPDNVAPKQAYYPTSTGPFPWKHGRSVTVPTHLNIVNRLRMHTPTPANFQGVMMNSGSATGTSLPSGIAPPSFKFSL
jgi:hypothetical protein